MASKRVLKQEINAITGELFFECLFCKLYLPNTDSRKADEVLGKILTLQDEFLRRANNYDGKEDKKIVRNYFKKLNADLQKKLDEIVADIESLGQPH